MLNQCKFHEMHLRPFERGLSVASGITSWHSSRLEEACCYYRAIVPEIQEEMQSFLGALNYYSNSIQDFAVYGAAFYQLKDGDFGPGGDLTTARRSFAMLKQKVAAATILRHFDRTKDMQVMLLPMNGPSSLR